MDMVPGERLELSRCYHRRILNPLRLPIPPSGLHPYYRLKLFWVNVDPAIKLWEARACVKRTLWNSGTRTELQ